MYPFLRGAYLLLTEYRKPLLPITEECSFKTRVMLGDIDFNFHLNASRYVTMTDFARLQMIIRYGMLKKMLKGKMKPVVGGVMCHYRQEILPFQAYFIKSRVLGWDDKWLFVEHRFVDLEDNLKCVVHARVIFISPNGSVHPMSLFEGDTKAFEETMELHAPHIRDILQVWLTTEKTLYHHAHDHEKSLGN